MTGIERIAAERKAVTWAVDHLAAWSALGPDLGQLIDSLFIIRGEQPSEWEAGVRSRLADLNLKSLPAEGRLVGGGSPPGPPNPPRPDKIREMG